MRDILDIRKHGIAYDKEEHQEGIISIAAPVLMDSGRIIGAVSVATSTSKMSLSDLSGFQAALLEAADAIGKDASKWQFPS
jgi:DNA-binding IclR family transcriptional regulator